MDADELEKERETYAQQECPEFTPIVGVEKGEGMKKVRFVWGTPGWGWRMYGLLCLESKKMWFFGLSRQKSEP